MVCSYRTLPSLLLPSLIFSSALPSLLSSLLNLIVISPLPSLLFAPLLLRALHVRRAVVGWFVDAGSLASLAPHRGQGRGLWQQTAWIKSSRSLGLVGYRVRPKPTTALDDYTFDVTLRTKDGSLLHSGKLLPMIKVDERFISFDGRSPSAAGGRVRWVRLVSLPLPRNRRYHGGSEAY